MENSGSTIPQFSGQNFDIWRVKMQTFMKSEDLWEFVEDGYVEPTPAEEERLKENKKRDAKALSYIQQAVSDDIFMLIKDTSKAKEAWNILQQKYGVQDAGNVAVPYPYWGPPPPQAAAVPYPYAGFPPQSYGYVQKPYQAGVHPPTMANNVPPYASGPPANNSGGPASSLDSAKTGVEKVLGKYSKLLDKVENTVSGSKPNDLSNIDMSIYQNLESSGPIVGPQYVTQGLMEMRVSRDIIALSDSRLTVTTMDGSVLFKIKGKLLSIADQKSLLDAQGNPIALFKEKKLSLHDTWYGYRGKSAKPEDMLFTAKRTSIIQFQQKLEVVLASNKNKNGCDFKVVGSPLARSFTVYAGNSETVVATMKKKTTAESFVLDQDVFILTVYPNIDFAFIVSLMIIYDGNIQEDK